MAQGAVFRLVLRDERFDNHFTASDYLRQRFDKIRAERAAAGAANVQPTFIDIERSHVLFIRAAYRPYVATASEYARVKASGDGTASISAAGGTCQFTFPTFGHFTSDMVVHVRFRPIGDPSFTPSTTTPVTAQTSPYLRYCAFPGLRLFRKVELRSDQVLVDDYTPDDAVAYGKFFVKADHRTGWDRCHGQQELREASYFGNNFTGSFFYRDGLQTPKVYHPAHDIYVPLQFWMCRDASNALLNDLIPNSQRTVTIDLAPLKDIVQALIPSGSQPAPGINDIVPIGLTPVELPFTRLGVEVNLYVNGLYVNPEIHDVFASRIGFSLIRVHRRQVNQLQSAAGSFLLDQLKFPAEYLLAGIRSRALANDFDRWWMMGVPVMRTDSNKLLVPAMVWNTAFNICQLVCRTAVEASTLESATDTLGLSAHGIVIFENLPALFYNGYLPLRYAPNSSVVSPVDTSAFLVNFCLYPGKADGQPSGHYNLSAGRELYLNYSLKPQYSDVGSGVFELVVAMTALNFLVRKGDSVALRYSL